MTPKTSESHGKNCAHFMAYIKQPDNHIQVTNAFCWYKLSTVHTLVYFPMGLLPDAYNCGLRMRRECRERFPSHRLQRKPLVSDPGMHHGTCVTHVPWCMSGSLVRGGGENVPGIPGACATHNFTYLVRGPWLNTNWIRYVLMITSLALVQSQCNNHVNPTNLLSNMRNFYYSDV